jgi:hypothetical protein
VPSADAEPEWLPINGNALMLQRWPSVAAHPNTNEERP